MILYLREEQAIKAFEQAIKTCTEKIIFNDLIAKAYKKQISETIMTIRYRHRIAHIETLYCHNSPMLLENPDLISISLFIMPLEEWKKLFIRDVKNTHLSGTNARSVGDMIDFCLHDGLYRTQRQEFIYQESNATIQEINTWIYSPKGANIYELIKDRDLSIKTINEEVIDFNISKNSLGITLNPKYKQSEVLKLFRKLPNNWIPSFDVYDFIIHKTTYKEPKSENYYLDFRNEDIFKKLNLHKEDKRELENLISFLRFLIEKDIIQGSMTKVSKVILSCLNKPIKGLGNRTIRKKLTKEGGVNLPNSIKQDLEEIIFYL